MFGKWMHNCAKPGVASGSFLAFWGMTFFHRQMYRYTLENLDIPPNGRVLDIGCGGGDFLARISRHAPGVQCVGIDYSPLSVKRSIAWNRHAVHEGRVKVIEGDVSNLPFPDATFDAITALATIYFWPDPRRNVCEVVRTLKPGGMFLVGSEVMDGPRAKKYVDRIPGMVYHTHEEIRDFFRQAGLVEVETHVDHPRNGVCIVGRKPGTVERVPCELSGIPETMLIPVAVRAFESRRPDAILSDEAAERILERLDYDCGVFVDSRRSQIGTAIRSVLLDRALRDFLTRHPDAVVVNLGAGLDTRIQRFQMEKSCRWIDIDVPEAIGLRRKFLPDDDRVKRIPRSMFDFTWMDEIHADGKPVLFIAEGLFMYFMESDLKPLFDRIAERFPGSEMLYELIAPMAVGRAKYNDSVPKLRNRPPFLWSMKCAADIEQWNTTIRYREEWNYFDYYRKRWGWFGVLARCPLLRTKFACRIVHIDFSGKTPS